jgi:MFS family permease
MQFFFWGTIIMMEGFMVPYLTTTGYAERQIGVVMASLFFLSIVTTPLWGYVADRTGGHRWIVAGCLVISIIAVIGIRASGTTMWLVVLFSLLYSMTLMSVPGLVDSWLMLLRRSGFNISYGIARGIGSLGYAVSGAILGAVLERFGVRLLFPIYASVMVIVVILVASMPGQAAINRYSALRQSASEEPGAAPRMKPVRAVLSNRRYLFLMSSCFLVFLGMRATMTFLPLRLYAAGGNTSHVGFAQAAMTASEIPFLLLSVLAIRRWQPRVLLRGVLMAAVLRLVMVRLAPTPGLLVAAQVLQGPSLGLMLPAMVHYIDRIAPEEHRSLFQTLAPAVYFGLSSVVGSSVGGIVVEAYGLDVLYTLTPVVAAAGALLFASSVRKRHTGPE